MKCPVCGKEDFAFTEEVKRETLLDKIICGLAIIGCIAWLFYGNPKYKYLSLIGIALTVIGEAIYKFFSNRTSRTKAICKSCFHYWYITDED